jgi:signal transduction histidine kinase
MNAAVAALDSVRTSSYPAHTAACLLPHEVQRMEAIGRFASGIVHDFNSVLAAIGVYAEMIVRQAHDAHQKQCAERMVAATQRGRNLVAQLLTYARNETTGLGPTDACVSINGALDMIRGLAKGGVTVESRVPTLPLMVTADSTQLEQVVTNLCTNGLQAMPKGGKLRVEVAPITVSTRCVVSHGSVGPGSHVLIRVQDEGCGMDEKTLARAFEPFFTTRGAGRGTGLGLAIVQTIVERFGGAIDVQTAPGKGTRFSIYLPAAKAAVTN